MPARLGWGHVTASSAWMPGAGMLRARATDSGEAAGRVRLYSSQALAQERCKPCSSEVPVTAARTRSKLSSRAAYASYLQHLAMQTESWHAHISVAA